MPAPAAERPRRGRRRRRTRPRCSTRSPHGPLGHACSVARAPTAGTVPAATAEDDYPEKHRLPGGRDYDPRYDQYPRQPARRPRRAARAGRDPPVAVPTARTLYARTTGTPTTRRDEPAPPPPPRSRRPERGRTMARSPARAGPPGDHRRGRRGGEPGRPRRLAAEPEQPGGAGGASCRATKPTPAVDVRSRRRGPDRPAVDLPSTTEEATSSRRTGTRTSRAEPAKTDHAAARRPTTPESRTDEFDRRNPLPPLAPPTTRGGVARGSSFEFTRGTIVGASGSRLDQPIGATRGHRVAGVRHAAVPHRRGEAKCTSRSAAGDRAEQARAAPPCGRTGRGARIEHRARSRLRACRRGQDVTMRDRSTSVARAWRRSSPSTRRGSPRPGGGSSRHPARQRAGRDPTRPGSCAARSKEPGTRCCWPTTAA